MHIKCSTHHKPRLKRTYYEYLRAIRDQWMSPLSHWFACGWLGTWEGGILPHVWFLKPQFNACMLNPRTLLQSAQTKGSPTSLGCFAGAACLSDSSSLTGTSFRTWVGSARHLITPSMLWHSLSENSGLAGRHLLARSALGGLISPLDLKSQPGSMRNREVSISSLQLTAKASEPSCAFGSDHSLDGRLAPCMLWWPLVAVPPLNLWQRGSPQPGESSPARSFQLVPASSLTPSSPEPQTHPRRGHMLHWPHACCSRKGSLPWRKAVLPKVMFPFPDQYRDWPL